MRDGPMLSPKGWWKKPPTMSPQEIVERIMTGHWDMAACHCWVCEAGHELGFGAREQYLGHKDPGSMYPVPVREEFMVDRPPAIIHGRTCPKAFHGFNSTWKGWDLNALHGRDDDRPFAIADEQFCGRCHQILPRERNKE